MKKLVFSFVITLLCLPAFSQNNEDVKWSSNFAESMNVFIENKGQFDGRNHLPGSKILYAADFGAIQIFFTKNGLTYYIDDRIRNRNRKKGDITKPKFFVDKDIIHLSWIGSNPDVIIESNESRPDYNVYALKSKTGVDVINNVKGYKKITYKELYPYIDVEYEFHAESGIKYSLILHPGADASEIRMKYDGDRDIFLKENGEIHIVTILGDILEHAPLSFYANNPENIIASNFILNNNEVSFHLADYDASKSIVIDPWVQTPTLASSNCVWECERDGAGNIYIIGGDKPMKVQKYNAAGVLQWTYNTPWDTTDGRWLGTIATDNAGNSYVTNGAVAEMQKINTNGSMVWYQTAPLLSTDEYWSIAFNCDQTKLIVGGTKGAPFPSLDYKGAVFDINTSNGNVTNTAIVANGLRSSTVTIPGFPPITSSFPNEVRAITSSRNAKYYYLTHDTVGAINQNITACSANPLFNIKSTYEFSYKCEDWRPLITDSDGNRAGNSGICAISANENFVYTQNGATVHKRSLATGTILASAAIPSGISNAVQFVTPTMYQPGNSGIDIDACGNVYVGSSNAVIKYDADLNFITSVATSYKVFDVEVTLNGEVIVCGSTGTSLTTPRTGYIEVVNMSACAPFALICCDATVCPINPLCTNDAPRNLSPVQSGGTWSGPGITNSSAGTFSPSVAGPGVHKIAYALVCGSDTVEITVFDCSALSVCKEPNGDLTVSGGTGPYNWQYYETGSTTPITNQAQCTACGYTWFGAPFNQCFSSFPIPADQCVIPAGWAPFATGTTATPPSYPVRVTDAAGTTLDIQNAASVPLCNTVVCPTITVSASSQTNVSCAGGNNGSVTVSASGGQTPYTYAWAGGATGATRNNLTAGSYVVTATDANNCTGTLSITITSPNVLSLNTSSTPATCGSNNGSATVNVTGGTPGYTYTWSNTATTATISNVAAGSYTVTVRDNNNCSATATIAVSSTGGATVALNNQSNISCNGANDGAIDINVTGGATPYTYTWSNGATTQDISALTPGTYTVTVNDNNNCPAIFMATITEPGILAVSGTTVNAGCGVPDGRVDISVNGGTSPFTFSWSTGATTEDLLNVPAGNYDVTVTDANNCTGTNSFTVISPGNMDVTLTPTDASCVGVSNGSVSSTVTGGIAPYQYVWSTGATTTGITNVAKGTYTVTVSDAANCTVVESVVVDAEEVIDLAAVITGINCDYDTIGAIKLIISGGTPPYTADWSTGEQGQTITGLTAGTYTTTVTDANGCTTDSTFVLASASGLNVAISATGLSCDGSGTGSAQAAAVGNEPPFTYEWSNGSTTAGISGLEPGAYTVIVTDALNCRDTTVAVIGIATLAIDTTILTLPQCDTTSDGAIEIIMVGGNNGYTFVWNNGQDSSTAVNLIAGVYTLTVTDLNNCSLLDTTVLNAEKICSDSLIIYDVFTPNGDGVNDLWFLDGLSNFADNELKIFNRWGSLVYEAKPYQNNWDGHSKKGDPLPSATYYYILKLNDAEGKVHSGHVTIIR
jgi:gliding motility-associated-like protein